MPIPKLRPTTQVMPFGKHKGKELEDVPADYLLWLESQELKDGYVKDYIKKNKQGLLKQVADDNIDRMDSGEVEHF